MKSLSIKLGVVLIGFLIFGYAEVWGADWKSFGKNEYYAGFYDAQSITRPSKNIVRVSMRLDCKETGVMDMVRRLGKKYENVSHLINLWEINCLEKKNRQLMVTSYDNKGGVIDSETNPSAQWDFIISESLGDELYKEVCK